MKSYRRVRAEAADKMQAAKDRAVGITPAQRKKNSMDAAVKAIEDAENLKKLRLKKAKDDGPDYE